MKLNKGQKMAVTTIDKNVSVNAGAGSGKTRVLVERYLYILENGDLKEGKEIESIVAITFTRKASQEMKERIRYGIRQRFSQNPKWNRLYRDLEKANIGTIHSFCGKILRENPIESGIDPLFSIMDDYESDELLEETINKCLIEGIEKNDKIYDLVKGFNVDILDRFVKTLMTLYKKIRSIGVSFEKVKDITLANIDSFKIEDKQIDFIKENIIYLMGKAKKGSKLYKLKEDPVWIDFLNKNIYDEDDIIEDLNYIKTRIGTMKDEEERIEALNNCINEAMKVKEVKYREKYKTLIDLLIVIDKKFTDKKKNLGYLDYEDLQILVLKLLEKDYIREKYQNKYRYIMVDEFQDTNELQKKILYKLCSRESKLDRENLFIVGDPKQSIYGFRGADVEVFFDVMKDMKEVSKKSPILLNTNYRSVSPVLKFVNDIFVTVMRGKYDSLEAHRVIDGLRVEVIEKEDLEIPEGFTPGEYNKYYESRVIAKRIKQLVDNDEYSYKDFVLLFRSSTEDYIYEEALKEYGIPYYNLGGKGFYSQEEIIDLINGLKSISNSYDTISLVGLLRSPMFGFSDKTIYWLLRKEKENLLDALAEELPFVDDRENKKVKKAYKLLNQLRIKKDMLKVDEILEELISNTYYIESLMLKHGSKQKVANIYKFIEISREYYKRYNGSIEDFIDYIEKMRTQEVEESQAKVETESGNTVKLMTIHKSKGLQFKVVVIPQMSKGFVNDTSDVLFDKTIGLGIKHKDFAPLYDEVSQIIREKEMEENKRILYVAMTRAEEKLILGNQGRAYGFKKLVNDIIEPNDVKVINEIGIEKESKEIRNLNIVIHEEGNFDKYKLPLLKNIDNFNQKSFNSFSVSQYMTFKECRRKFYMTYYKKLPVNRLSYEGNGGKYSLDSATRGQIVHKFCEIYKSNLDKKDLLEKIVNSLGFELNEEIYKEVNPYVENYMKLHRENFDNIYNEKSFFYQINTNYIYGIIDRINIKDDKAEILDFKTNKVKNKEKFIKQFEPQIQLYVNAFQDIYGIEVERARLLLLETGEFVDIDISKKNLENNINKLNQFINFVIQHKNIEDYSKGKNCDKYCNFKFLCQ